MNIRVHSQQKTPQPSTAAPVVNPFQSRPFAVQAQAEQSLPQQQEMLDGKEQQEKVKRCGYNFANISVSDRSKAAPEPPIRLQANFEQRQPAFEVGKVSPLGSYLRQNFHVQPKLTIGQPGDKYEQEADSVAEQVISIPELATGRTLVQRQGEEEESLQKQSLAGSITPLVQRQEEEDIHGVQANQSLENRLAAQKGGGSPLSKEVRSFMEPRFGTDFSQVRVHTNSEAVQMNRELHSQAFTHGRDLYFGALKYNPSSTDGKRLLAHELTHVVQQTGGVQPKLTIDPLWQRATADGSNEVSTASTEIPVPLSVQRRELPKTPKTGILNDGDWTTADREGNTTRWKDANLYNLNNLRNDQYTQIIERRDFYKWFYEYTAALGYQTRWALAAWVVANGAYEIASMDWLETVSNPLGAVNNELQGMMRTGNQVIFDNVFPKLKLLLDGGLKTGKDALDWDMKVLSEEQELIQPLYKGISSETVAKLEAIAKMGWKAKVGTYLPGEHADKVKAGKYNKGGTVPAFSGDITNVDDRWKFGMKLGQEFSPSPTYGSTMPTRPSVGKDYTSGAELATVNVGPGIHRLDAMLNDADIPEQGVINTIKGLSLSEQSELLGSSSRRDRLLGALNWDEFKQAITSMRVSLVRQMEWLNAHRNGGWLTVDYSEIKDMIVAAPQAQRDGLKTYRWMKVFVDICNNKTMREALADLKFDSETERRWIAAEE